MKDIDSKTASITIENEEKTVSGKVNFLNPVEEKIVVDSKTVGEKIGIKGMEDPIRIEEELKKDHKLKEEKDEKENTKHYN